MLTSSAWSVKKFEFLLANINLLSEIKSNIESAGTLGWEVQPGWQLGTPKARSGCEDFVRVTVREIANRSSFIDPNQFIAKAPIGLPQWITEADQWIVKFLKVLTLKQVSI